MSASTMNVNHLKKDELEYELAYRGMKPEEMLVADMRASLRSLIKLERANRSVVYQPYAFVAATELEAISKKYDELDGLVKESDGDVARLARCGSRGLHLLGRVDHIPIKPADAALSSSRGEWLAKVSALLGRLQYGPAKPAHLDISAALIGPEDRNREDDDDSLSDADDAEQSVLNQTLGTASSHTPMGRRIPIHKWNVKFTGEAGSPSVMDFLERVAELRVARGYSEEELYRSSLDLFAGKALLWYRSNLRRTKTWTDLSNLLKRDYLPPDYRSRLFQEILTRTQGPDEKIVEYLACMNALVDRYGSMSRDVVLDIVRRNLAPFYITQMPEVRSLEELETACLRLETVKYRAENYRAPPKKSKECVEPDLACLSTGVESVDLDPSDGRPSARAITCFGCGRRGHVRRFCPQRRPQRSENPNGRS